MESAVGTNIDDPVLLSCPYPVCFGVISPVLMLKKSYLFKEVKELLGYGEHMLQTACHVDLWQRLKYSKFQLNLCAYNSLLVGCF